MITNRAAALLRIHYSELGFAVRDTEPGGAVNDGITMQKLREWDAAHGLPEPTIDDLRNLSLDTEQRIYLEAVFAPVRFDELQSGVDYVEADDATNSGLAGALNRARAVFGLPVPAASWRMEDALLQAMNAGDPLTIVNALCDARWEHMKSSPDFWLSSHTDPTKHVADGRAKRINVVYGGALQFAGIPLPPEPRYLVPAPPQA